MPVPDPTPPITHVPAAELHTRLGLAAAFEPPEELRTTPLHAWCMERHDSVILAYLYGQLRPRRHLEFGTWRGLGAVLCLRHCDATVWSINLRAGESDAEGKWVYYESKAPDSAVAPGVHTRVTPKGNLAVQTDGGAAVGAAVYEHRLGHRFCQVLCDSREWDTSNYPPDFFDTVLIDGGHTEEVVASDTRKALEVLRPGGVVLWHDYCPVGGVAEWCGSVRGVLAGVASVRPWLDGQLRDLFWLDPSWLLVGVKR